MSDASLSPDILKRMDESKITRDHWKILFLSGTGFFTDAYDLFIIGVVMSLLKEQWHFSAVAEGLVTSTALLASAVGALLFGRIADMLGRKRIYGYEVLVLAAGAVASAFSPNIWWLIAFRIILGLGIGGDYPVSSTIMSEFAGKSTRGLMVTLVFSMQAAGLVIGPLLAVGLLATPLSHDLIWRILLAAGAIPALAVFQMRRHLAETPRFLLASGQQDASRTSTGKASFWEGFALFTSHRDLMVRLIGASAAWFVMDFAYYGNTVSSPLVLSAITPNGSIESHTLIQLAVFAIAALPGYLLAAAMMDRMGRKTIQILGFAMMALTFAGIALIPGIEKLLIPFLLVYGISYFFTEFGPNSTTFVYPSEIFPVLGRTTGHGIASSAGKLGGFIGVFLFPIFMAAGGLALAEAVAAIVSVLGIVVTATMLPETKGKSLEELNPELGRDETRRAGSRPSVMTCEDFAKAGSGRDSAPSPDRLLHDVYALRGSILEEAPGILRGFLKESGSDPALTNLAHYLALRHHDLRPLQRELMWHGVTSLGRLESRVLPTLDAAIAALSALSGKTGNIPAPSRADFFAGEARLKDASTTLLGPAPAHRYTRIMVTLPSEAATDAGSVFDLASKGMEIARINCAHDDGAAWVAMARNIRSAGERLGRKIAVLMDIAGPKIRVEAVTEAEKKIHLTVGDSFRLVTGERRVDADARVAASVSLPEMVTRLSVGDRVLYDDGKLAGEVEKVDNSEAVVRITHTKTGGIRLKAQKGVNLPDTALGLSPLTGKDEVDLASVLDHADMLGYSFISHADDIDLLDAALKRHERRDRPLGLIAKIERPAAIGSLPGLIARARGRAFGVMIARGDLAAEVGFERMAEIQEELLWICEAAAVPTIWATQVLETLVKEGIPSRGEMTDAAMSARAECVMLNKGPAVGEAIVLLDGLLSHMDGHQSKKTPQLRALKSW